ncbi:hypothetical protein VP01_2203g2 [Puccinia sorghi]|uniref:Uncharacterized protein n=1 Tax=Puccinia sorghi TaxID=27349 RepID=A0A0L6VAS7_9BASI|nr:hypothetical protein VP01_2203g2 [Puccinia sorghi]
MDPIQEINSTTDHQPKGPQICHRAGSINQTNTRIHPSHVKMVIDVNADGYGGYQVVAHALGRGEELEFYCKEYTFENIDQTLSSIYPTTSELVGTKHWMSMSSMVEAMANEFERPVFFSSLTSPSIYIVFQPKTHHFVYLMMKGPYEFPAPRYLKNWEKSANKEALANYTPQTSRRPTIVTFKKPHIKFV